MIDIERAIRSDRIMKAVTGVTIEEFNNLLEKFTEELEKARLSSASPAKRCRASGAGRKHTLNGAREKLFFILFYLKCYPTYDLAGISFDVDRSQACRWVEQWLPILTRALGGEVVLPAKGIASGAEFKEKFHEVTEIYIDGTERPVQRPVDVERQKACYSGKKKRHTKKNLIVSDERKKVLILTKTCEGKKHDYAMFKETELGDVIPDQCPVFVDLGFQGMETDYPHLIVMIPFKKPKGGALSEVEKKFNKVIAQCRVLSEHTIAGIKRLRCVTDMFRNKRAAMADTFMKLACGIWNLHVDMLGLSIA